ncbi:MAG: 50S ribosomal protein L13 [bacterium]|nr:50S ribosomal protein L13 [bacterium]
MKTTNKKTKNNEVKVVDAEGKTLGRLATEIAMKLMGKDSPSFERNMYTGSPVSVVNASKINITPKKLESLQHLRYSGYPGGLRTTKGTETKEKKGMRELVRFAVERMLPKNKLQREMMKHLTVTE